MTSLGDIFRTLKASGEVEGLEMIVPAYYWLEHHHAGLWSWEYEAFCRLGQTFRPGIGSLDSEPEYIQDAYQTLCQDCEHSDD